MAGLKLLGLAGAAATLSGAGAGAGASAGNRGAGSGAAAATAGDTGAAVAATAGWVGAAPAAVAASAWRRARLENACARRSPCAGLPFPGAAAAIRRCPGGDRRRAARSTAQTAMPVEGFMGSSVTRRAGHRPARAWSHQAAAGRSRRQPTRGAATRRCRRRSDRLRRSQVGRASGTRRRPPRHAASVARPAPAGHGPTGCRSGNQRCRAVECRVLDALVAGLGVRAGRAVVGRRLGCLQCMRQAVRLRAQAEQQQGAAAQTDDREPVATQHGRVRAHPSARRPARGGVQGT